MDDPDVAEFIRYLEGEKDASKHTIQNYLIDIRQFCEKKWGTDVPAPYAWAEVDRYDARAYLIHFSENGYGSDDYRSKTVCDAIILSFSDPLQSA